MERVETLLEKLHKQINEGAKPSQLLLTVQMLHHELLHLQNSEDIIDNGLVTVFIPAEPIPILTTHIPEEVKPVEEEKIIEVLQVDEAAIEAELEEIKRN